MRIAFVTIAIRASSLGSGSFRSYLRREASEAIERANSRPRDSVSPSDLTKAMNSAVVGGMSKVKVSCGVCWVHEARKVERYKMLDTPVAQYLYASG